jgi:hypothetical protein
MIVDIVFIIQILEIDYKLCKLLNKFSALIVNVMVNRLYDMSTLFFLFLCHLII